MPHVSSVKENISITLSNRQLARVNLNRAQSPSYSGPRAAHALSGIQVNFYEPNLSFVQAFLQIIDSVFAKFKLTAKILTCYEFIMIFLILYSDLTLLL